MIQREAKTQLGNDLLSPRIDYTHVHTDEMKHSTSKEPVSPTNDSYIPKKIKQEAKAQSMNKISEYIGSPTMTATKEEQVINPISLGKINPYIWRRTA